MTEKVLLENGVRVLLDFIPYLRSVCVGIWVGAGSRLEGSKERGISHFIEHMLFKGTQRRTAQQIATEIDAVGGILNGFTSREYSSFFAKVMGQHLPMAIDLLTDLYVHATFDPLELERERGVILQEIRMVEDTPEEHVMDIFHRLLWKGSPMGYPIQGDPDSVSRIQREALLDRLGRHYHHREALVSISGHFGRAEVIRMLGEQTSDLTVAPRWPSMRAPETHPGIHIIPRELEQVHVCVGTRSPAATNRDRFAYYLLNTILGGGMSSRLFQEVREKRGLAYSVYSFCNTYADAGVLGICLGTTPETLHEALTVVMEQMADMAEAPLAEETLAAAREQIKGELVLSLESSDRRMGRQARDELYFGREVPVEEVFEELEAVTPEAVFRAAGEAFQWEGLSGVILGRATPSHLPAQLRSFLA